MILVLSALACREDPAEPEPRCSPGTPSLPVPDFHAAPPPLVESIAPSALDPLTDQQPEDVHEVYFPADGPTRDPLFVLLPGTDGRPENYANLLTIAAQSGYRAIGLAYPTESNQNDLCGNDEACLEGFVREKLYGVDETSVVAVDEADSVVGRLVRLLAALDARHPGEGFDRYLDGGAPAWGAIAIAGFSQGSGIASWVAMDEPVARFVTFSSGCDSVGTNPADSSPAAWCYRPRETGPDRTFGLLHTEDYFAVKQQVFVDALGLDAFGDFADADASAPDYCTGTHILTTSATPRDPTAAQAYHQSLATDPDMPVDADGVPLLAEDQWYLMAGG